MELLIEFLFELIFEGSIELAQSPKVPKWIRFILIVILMTFILGVIFGIGTVGVIAIMKGEKGIGIFLLAVTAILVGGCVYKFIELYKKNKK